MTILAAVFIAVVVGVAVGWIAASRKASSRQQLLLDRISRTESAIARAVAERDAAIAERERADRRSTDLEARIAESSAARVTAETRLVESERLLGEQRTFVETSKKQLEDSFAVLANRTLRSVGDQLLQAGKAQIDGSLETRRVEIDAMLRPLREMVDSYRGELVKSEQTRNEVYGGLQEQLRGLLTAGEESRREAARLANALQSPTVRGSWGENTLQRCVELAGMSEFCDFSLQMTFENDEGRRLRPDLIVRLPNKRMIAIDAKVPLSDYTAAANESDELRRREHLALHVKTVRRHIDALSRREYQLAIGDSLDFVVLFIPGEHFLSAALVTDPTLFDYAAERKVYLASPTVLLPLLRAIAAGWKAERTEENAKKMHDAAVDLFNRFVKVMEDIARVGGALGQAVERYNTAIRSIDARLFPKANELQRMSGSGRELGEMEQIEATPLESTKLRLTSTSETPGDVVPIAGYEK